MMRLVQYFLSRYTGITSSTSLSLHTEEGKRSSRCNGHYAPETDTLRGVSVTKPAMLAMLGVQTYEHRPCLDPANRNHYATYNILCHLCGRIDLPQGLKNTTFAVTRAADRCTYGVVDLPQGNAFFYLGNSRMATCECCGWGVRISKLAHPGMHIDFSPVVSCHGAREEEPSFTKSTQQFCVCDA